MGIFQRLSTLIKSNVNDAISKAEDPEKMMSQLLADMSEQYSKAKTEVAKAIADEKRLQKEYDDQLAKVQEWNKKAELAVNAGNDNLAMEALKRKNEYSSLAESYKVELEAQKQTTEKLKESLKNLSDKIEEAKRKKNILMAKARKAKAQTTINKTMAGLNDTSTFDAFNRVEQKVNSLEYEAEASSELDSLAQKDNLEAQFEELENNNKDSKINDELAALKAKLGK